MWYFILNKFWKFFWLFDTNILRFSTIGFFFFLFQDLVLVIYNNYKVSKYTIFFNGLWVKNHFPLFILKACKFISTVLEERNYMVQKFH